MSETLIRSNRTPISTISNVNLSLYIQSWVNVNNTHNEKLTKRFQQHSIRSDILLVWPLKLINFEKIITSTPQKIHTRYYIHWYYTTLYYIATSNYEQIHLLILHLIHIRPLQLWTTHLKINFSSSLFVIKKIFRSIFKKIAPLILVNPR